MRQQRRPIFTHFQSDGNVMVMLIRTGNDIGVILGMGSANERRRYIVTSSFIGWAHTQCNPCNMNITYTVWIGEVKVAPGISLWLELKVTLTFQILMTVPVHPVGTEVSVRMGRMILPASVQMVSLENHVKQVRVPLIHIYKKWYSAILQTITTSLIKTSEDYIKLHAYDSMDVIDDSY